MRSLSAAGAPAAGGTTDLSDNNDYYDDSVTLQFALNFNALKCGVWWLLFLLALTYGLLKRNVVSRAWFIFTALIIILGFNGVQTSCYVAYAKHVEEGHSGIVAYLIYIAFFNLSRSAFLVSTLQPLTRMIWRDLAQLHVAGWGPVARRGPAHLALLSARATRT